LRRKSSERCESLKNLLIHMPQFKTGIVMDYKKRRAHVKKIVAS